MKIPCGTCSWIEVQQCSYEIVNGNLKQLYTNEVGIAISLGGPDVANAWTILSNSADGLRSNPGTLGYVGNALAEIVQCATQTPNAFTLPKEGSVQMLFLSHACRVGNQEFCTPDSTCANWQNVKHALNQLDQDLRSSVFSYGNPTRSTGPTPGVTNFNRMPNNVSTNHVNHPSVLVLNRAIPFYNA